MGLLGGGLSPARCSIAKRNFTGSVNGDAHSFAILTSPGYGNFGRASSCSMIGHSLGSSSFRPDTRYRLAQSSSLAFRFYERRWNEIGPRFGLDPRYGEWYLAATMRFEAKAFGAKILDERGLFIHLVNPRDFDAKKSFSPRFR